MSRSMDISEPSPMDVAHDTIFDSRSGASRSCLLLVRRKKAGLFLLL